ncbi:MAG: ATP-grasp domain-containing protein [Gaiellaceae bacterium]
MADARVLVTDGEERSVLAVCRGLNAAGYEVSAVASAQPALAHWSRSVRGRFTLPDPREDGFRYVEGLAEILGRHPQEVVMPGTDASLVAVSEHRALIESLALVGLPSHENVLRSLDKLALLEEAAAAGLPAPPSVTCSERGEVAAAAAELGYPVVLKPPRSFVPSATGDAQRTVRIVRGERDLAAALAGFPLPVTVQRFEEGAAHVSVGGVIADGRLLGAAVSRYMRLWPPEAGSVAFSETIVPPPGLLDRTEALVGSLGSQGIFELELLDLKDGLAVLDLNPRPYGSLSLAVTAGANLPAIWCDWLLGRDPAPVVARAGVRYRWEDADLGHLLWQLRRGHWRAAGRVLVPHRRVTHALFKVTDPAPLAARAALIVARRAAR